MEREDLLKSLIGKTEEEGRETCEIEGYHARVTREDDKDYIITMDFRFDRINFELDNGKITNCDIG